MVSQNINFDSCLKSNNKDNRKYTKYEFIFWSVTLIALCSGMSYQLYSLVDKYLKYDYDEVTLSSTDNPVFPDVTVCNMDAIYGKSMSFYLWISIYLSLYLSVICSKFTLILHQ